MRSGFFNSEITGYDAENMPIFDRAEDASFFAKFFNQFISNGVFPNPSTNMQVLADTGMQIKVSIGTCFINGYMGWVENAEIKTIEESDIQARIDRVVARLDFDERKIDWYIKKGTASGNPVAPELQRDYDIYEIGLADIRVNANIIEIKDLRKYFGDIHAVDGISFRVKEGELFSFLGLNGAGKSTTISVICGLLRKDSGEVLICGKDPDDGTDEIKSAIGAVFQTSRLDLPLSVNDNLKTRASLYGITGQSFRNRIEELDALFNIKDLLHRPFGKLSGGQKRRIDIARALIHDPKILILDEPTTGLDPQSRIMVWDAIKVLRKTHGLTVFLTTHYMEEAAESDFIVIIDSGKIAAEGTPHDLKEKYAHDLIKLYGADAGRVSSAGLEFKQENGYLSIPVRDTEAAKELILKMPDLFTDFEVVKGNMDDVFLNATGKKLSGSEDFAK